MSIGAPTKVKLNSPQLRNGKLTQWGRHQSGSQEIPGLILTGGSIFVKFISLFPTSQMNGMTETRYKFSYKDLSQSYSF